jgi:hypothetical protein
LEKAEEKTSIDHFPEEPLQVVERHIGIGNIGKRLQEGRQEAGKRLSVQGMLAQGFQVLRGPGKIGAADLPEAVEEIGEVSFFHKLCLTQPTPFVNQMGGLGTNLAIYPD